MLRVCARYNYKTAQLIINLLSEESASLGLVAIAISFVLQKHPDPKTCARHVFKGRSGTRDGAFVIKLSI